MSRPRFCVIFDIDETMIQYLHDESSIRKWHSYKKFFPNRIEAIENGTNIILFRPGLREFIHYAQKHNIDLAIWTYGNKAYSNMIDEVITEYADLRKSPFEFVYSREEIQADLANGREEKDLRRVFDAFPRKYNNSNTFLVDNRAANVFHHSNRENGIVVESFDITAGYSPNGDTMFETLKHICDKNPSFMHSIFSKVNVVRTGLEKLYKKYIVRGEPLSLICDGFVDEDSTFYRANPMRKKPKLMPSHKPKLMLTKRLRSKRKNNRKTHKA